MNAMAGVYTFENHVSIVFCAKLKITGLHARTYHRRTHDYFS